MALLKRKRSGLTDPMSVVTRFVNACNRQDAEGVASCLHAEFDSIQPMFPARNFRGADQVRRNWQAIFDAEPGFRLTVLRQAAIDDTVWLELHGAGRDAEVAGVFVMGIEGDRVRWARIYSGLVEPLPPGYEDAVAAAAPAPLREVPPLEERADGEASEVVEEDLIAPVLDIDGGGRPRRRRSRRRAQEEAGTGADIDANRDSDWAALAEEPVAPEEPVPVEVVAAEPVSGGEMAGEPVVDQVAAEPAVEPAVDEVPGEPAVDEGPPTMLVQPDSLATGPHPQVPAQPDPPAAEPELPAAEPEPPAGGDGDSVTEEDLVVVPEAEPLLAEPEMESEPEPDPLLAEPEVIAGEEPVAVEPPDGEPETAVIVAEAPAPAEARSEPEVVAPPVAEPEHERPGKWLGRKRR